MKCNLWMKDLGTGANGIWPNIILGVFISRSRNCLIQLGLVDLRPELVQIVNPECTILVPGEGIDVCLFDTIQVLDGGIISIVSSIRIVEEPEVGVVLIWLLDARFAESVSCSHQAVNIDIPDNDIDTASLILANGLFDSSVQCQSHQVEVLAQVCGHQNVWLAITLRIRKSCKSHRITPGILIVEKLAITSHV